MERWYTEQKGVWLTVQGGERVRLDAGARIRGQFCDGGFGTVVRGFTWLVEVVA
jgi:hypothetical protein